MRVFAVPLGINFTVQNLTIANGNSVLGGGILNNGGSLTVIDSTFSGNESDGGGGIVSTGTATVTNSTFSGNPRAWTAASSKPAAR